MESKKKKLVLVIDEKGRQVVVGKEDGVECNYYIGPDTEGVIRRDDKGEYVMHEGKRRYWRGVIEPVSINLNQKEYLECSLIIIKPDVQKRNLFLSVMRILKEVEFQVVLKKKVVLNDKLVYKLYPYFFETTWGSDLLDYLSSGTSLCLLVVGRNVADNLLKIRSNIRELYSPESSMINLVHCSDSTEEAIREALIFFAKEEIINALKIK